MRQTPFPNCWYVNRLFFLAGRLPAHPSIGSSRHEVSGFSGGSCFRLFCSRHVTQFVFLCDLGCLGNSFGATFTFPVWATSASPIENS